jgi:hypothetical protein
MDNPTQDGPAMRGSRREEELAEAIKPYQRKEAASIAPADVPVPESRWAG